MAFTYDDFVAAANNAGIMNKFSQRDLTVAQSNPEYGMSMVGLLQDISKANTEEQRLLATEAANQMRKNYGIYNTGSTTADYNYASSYGSTIDDLLSKINGYGSFDYDGRDSYQQLLDSIVNQQPFSYDLQSDPSWGSYKKAYMREGDRASANALAQASAASGGRASSYAMTAAQQAGNYYAGQLADMIPALEQAAYSRYLSDFNNRLSSLGALENDRAFDYQNWMNEYNMLQNSLGNYQGQDATDYQRYLDALAQQNQSEQNKIAQEQQAYENALALYQTLGYATPEVAEILGIKAGSSGGGGSYGSSGGNGSGTGAGYNNGGLSSEQIRELQNVLGVTADGKYGSKSRSAAGGLSAEEAYAKYVADGSGDLVTDMMAELQGDVAPESVDTSNFTVTNRNGSGWIAIGNGRMSWTELERAVNQGTVIEVIDPVKGTITYKYASSTGGNTGNDSSKKNSGSTGGAASGGKKDDFTYVALN